MNNLFKSFFLLMFSLTTLSIVAGEQFTSPNGKIKLQSIGEINKPISFVVTYTSEQVSYDVLTISSIGILTREERGIKLRLDKIIGSRLIREDYTMLSGKRRKCKNEAFEYVCLFLDSLCQETRMIVRLYNDGIAFRYELNGMNKDIINDELTAYHISEGTKRWTQKYNLSYEDFYPEMISGEVENRHCGYPALIQRSDDVWALISESGIEKCHSASFLSNEQSKSDYKVTLAQNQQTISGNWKSPWRILIVGSLSDVVESTLMTDVACSLKETDWIHPGSASWVYWAYNRGSKDYQIVKNYIDMAAQLNLPYVLIDWEWDVMGNGGAIEDALKYAKKLGVRILLWYNSSTAWTKNGAGGPLFRLNSQGSREKEFAWLQKMGVAGVKIDFFSGDTQETMNYCLELLECAARHKLLVNFHGATIPRGWQRTYPNLLTVEAVYGAEWYNNLPVLTDKAAAHNTTLPFIRNVIGSMDYTPCTFSDSQHPHITTHAHELALAVVFESGLLHWADKPDSYLAQPVEVKKFMGKLPSTWDDTKLVSGYPANHVILARRKGATWYIGGLNGTDNQKILKMDWSFLDGVTYNLEVFEDSESQVSPWKILSKEYSIDTLLNEFVCNPRGGFVAVVHKLK